MEEAVASGLTRVIVSLDTLDAERNRDITRRGFHTDTLTTIERAVELLPTLTKISCVAMRQTLQELPAFVDYIREINSRGHEGQLALKLNQFFPSNPAQLGTEGEEFWKDQFVSEDVILATLAEAGTLVPVPRQSIEGDNPSYNYYQVGDTGVMVALLAMFSWDYPCGGCLKLRVSPNGLTTICISQKDAPRLWGMSQTEKRETFAQLTDYRTSERFDLDNPARKHYRDQLGELRFDRVVGDERPIAYFRTILARDAEVPSGVSSDAGA
jgi:cyclic pyranopterin phosphate synthase